MTLYPLFSTNNNIIIRTTGLMMSAIDKKTKRSYATTIPLKELKRRVNEILKKSIINIILASESSSGVRDRLNIVGR